MGTLREFIKDILQPAFDENSDAFIQKWDLRKGLFKTLELPENQKALEVFGIPYDPGENGVIRVFPPNQTIPQDDNPAIVYIHHDNTVEIEFI